MNFLELSQLLETNFHTAALINTESLTSVGHLGC